MNSRLFSYRIKGTPVVLLGHDRSGTSWIADSLFRHPAVRFFYEPSNPSSQLSGNWNFWNRIPDAKAAHPDLEAAYDPIFSGTKLQVTSLRTVGTVIYKSLFQSSRIGVKDVGLMLAGEWFQRRYGATIIYTKRHPMAIAASCLKQGEQNAEKWLKSLRTQERIEEFIRPELFRHAERADSIAKKMLAAVAIRHRILSHQVSCNPDWIEISYEEACMEPQRAFTRCLNSAAIPIPTDLDEWLESTTQTSDSNMYGRKRRSSGQPDKWKSDFPNLSDLREFYLQFEIPWYDGAEHWMAESR